MGFDDAFDNIFDDTLNDTFDDTSHDTSDDILGGTSDDISSGTSDDISSGTSDIGIYACQCIVYSNLLLCKYVYNILIILELSSLYFFNFYCLKNKNTRRIINGYKE